jgi:hypothetical protein
VSLPRAAAPLIALALMALGACSGARATEVVAPTPTGSVASACDAVMAALPDTLNGHAVNAERGTYWRSWGSPAIVVRCGVVAPSALAPTSRCDEINAVGWFTEETADGYRFTTIGRVGYIEVTVPSSYAPEGAMLAPLADAVSQMGDVTPCQ